MGAVVTDAKTAVSAEKKTDIQLERYPAFRRGRQANRQPNNAQRNPRRMRDIQRARAPDQLSPVNERNRACKGEDVQQQRWEEDQNRQQLPRPRKLATATLCTSNRLKQTQLWMPTTAPTCWG